MSKYTKFDYLQDLTGIRIHHLYGADAILAVFWFASILGLIAIFVPDLVEPLYNLYTLGHPTVFVILWVLIPTEIFFNFKNITEKLSDIHHTNPGIRIFNYLLFSTLSLGFGLIFGTLGLFANMDDLISYLFAMVVGLSFSNICAIIARGYLRDSPITEFFTTKIITKFPRLGYLW